MQPPPSPALPPLNLVARLGVGFTFDWMQLISLTTTGSPSSHLKGYLSPAGDGPTNGLAAASLVLLVIVAILTYYCLHCSRRGTALRVTAGGLARAAWRGRAHLLFAVNGRVRFHPIGSGCELSTRNLSTASVAEEELGSRATEDGEHDDATAPFDAPPFDAYEDESWDVILDPSIEPTNAPPSPRSLTPGSGAPPPMSPSPRRLSLPKAGLHTTDDLRHALTRLWSEHYGQAGTPAQWADVVSYSHGTVRGMVLRHLDERQSAAAARSQPYLTPHKAAISGQMIHSAADFGMARCAPYRAPFPPLSLHVPPCLPRASLHASHAPRSLGRT